MKTCDFNDFELKDPENFTGGRLWPLGWIEEILQNSINEDKIKKKIL